MTVDEKWAVTEIQSVILAYTQRVISRERTAQDLSWYSV